MSPIGAKSYDPAFWFVSIFELYFHDSVYYHTIRRYNSTVTKYNKMLHMY